MNIEEMTIEELKQLKRQRYEDAKKNSTIGALWLIAEQLGKDPISIEQPGYVSRYGPKRVFIKEDIHVYVDGYGGYMTVHIGDKEVCSTHQTNQFIIPGDWIETILAHYDEAVVRRDERKAAQVVDERSRLLNNLM